MEPDILILTKSTSYFNSPYPPYMPLVIKMIPLHWNPAGSDNSCFCAWPWPPCFCKHLANRLCLRQIRSFILNNSLPVFPKELVVFATCNKQPRTGDHTKDNDNDPFHTKILPEHELELTFGYFKYLLCFRMQNASEKSVGARYSMVFWLTLLQRKRR